MWLLSSSALSKRLWRCLVWSIYKLRRKITMGLRCRIRTATVGTQRCAPRALHARCLPARRIFGMPDVRCTPCEFRKRPVEILFAVGNSSADISYVEVNKILNYVLLFIYPAYCSTPKFSFSQWPRHFHNAYLHGGCTHTDCEL